MVCHIESHSMIKVLKEAYAYFLFCNLLGNLKDSVTMCVNIVISFIIFSSFFVDYALLLGLENLLFYIILSFVN